MWRRSGERFLDDCISESTAYGGGSVMVWGGISLHTRTPLYHVRGNLNAIRYRDEILQPLVVPQLQLIGADSILQDDNAKPHRANIVKTFIRQQGINPLPWPANSPDLNTIEHLWDELGRRVKNNYPPAGDLNQLLQNLHQEWIAIPQACLAKLVRSMRNRCRECLDNHGGHTRY